MKKIVALVLSLVMVLGLATTAFGATTSYDGLYAGFTSEGASIVPVDSVDFFKAEDNEVDEDGAWEANGNVAYYTVSGDVNLEAYVYAEVKTLAEADVVVYTDAAGKGVFMYLAKIPTGATYYADGAVTTNFGTACGQYNVKDAAYDKKATYVVALGDLYVADKVSPEKVLLVDGKLVGVDASAIEKIGHAPVYTRDEDGEITAIKCSKCGAVATEAPNYASLPEDAVRVGTTLWYWVVGAAVETDKVESAETFDAGIAMYVGMSVMAAAGSAVVLKKKD